MGQIIIELPGNINRRYLLEDTEVVEELLDDIEQVATRVKTRPAANPARLTAEDAADIRAARRARRGDLIDWQEVKKSLGLD